MKEIDIISALQASIDQSSSEVVVPIGDDGSVTTMNSSKQLVTTTDAITVDVHYPKGIDPESIGHRCLAINLSDIAAMGAIAKCYTLSLTLPKLDKKWLEQFSSSLKESSKLFHVNLIGGDTTKGPLNITITMMGSIEIDRSIKRSGARDGDDIYVTGDLGSAALCLKKIKEGEKWQV